jgi:hypothetical protein
MCSLKICLWVAGILCLLSGFALFLPMSALESFAKALGTQVFPDSPLFAYMARVVSAMAAAMGVYLIILARHSMK